MEKLQYFITRPAFYLTEQKKASFDALIAATPPGAYIDYQLETPKWQFLSYLCGARELVLHGSQNPAIEVVEPRKARDVREFSAQEAIYATTDGIWVEYFALVDREHFGPLSLFNSCIEVCIPPGQVIGPLYFFSITHAALAQNPWREGTVYLLPREGFTQEPAQQMAGAEIRLPHWISTSPALPVAKLRVLPADFPFLHQVHGHDDELLPRLAAEDPNGFPWPAALVG